MPKYELTDKRKAEFDRRPDEDVYQWLARQIDMATPFEATWLYLIRSDPKQHEALMMNQAAKAARWQRVASAISALALVAAVVAIFVR